MNAYKEAFEAATLTGDSLIMGRIQQYIGMLLYSQGFYKEALIPFKKAVAICEHLPEKRAEYYGNIGRCFILMKENDSALHYYEKGIELTEQTGNRKTQSRLLQNMSVLYTECKMNEEALSALRQSLQANPDSIRDPHYNLNFAELFMLTNQNDSLSYYINLMKNDLNSITDKTLLASSYYILSKYARLNKNYDSVFYYQSEYYKITENIYQERLQQSVYEIQQKYDFEAEQNKYNVMLLKRRNRIIALTILLSISVICFCLYSINRRKKESALLNELLSLEHKTKELNNQRDDLKQEIDILKKEQIKFEKQNNEGRINEI